MAKINMIFLNVTCGLCYIICKKEGETETAVWELAVLFTIIISHSTMEYEYLYVYFIIVFFN